MSSLSFKVNSDWWKLRDLLALAELPTKFGVGVVRFVDHPNVELRPNSAVLIDKNHSIDILAGDQRVQFTSADKTEQIKKPKKRKLPAPASPDKPKTERTRSGPAIRIGSTVR